MAAAAAASRLTLLDANRVLFRCGEEERAAGRGGAYAVPGLGELTFTGLEGVAHPARAAVADSSPGHALCAHLRDGDWLPECLHRRLAQILSAAELACLVEPLVAAGRALPRDVAPAYFFGWFWCSPVLDRRWCPGAPD